ncbi:MAG: hypothetical protein IJZ88_06700 [Clostridia bacterium]|nr:hypothetical protein [Clostridia bacterium]
MKKIISVALMIVLALFMFSACTSEKTSTSDDFVLTKEIQRYSSEFESADIISIINYKYAADGRLIGEDYSYPGAGSIISENYAYDSNSVVSKTERYIDEFTNEETISNYKYEYDESGNVIVEEMTNDSGEQYKAYYKYNEKGKVVSEQGKRYYGDEWEEYEKTFLYTYSGDLCCCCEVTTESTVGDEIETDYCAYTYEYDSEGRLKEKWYYVICEDGEVKEPLELDGKILKHYSTTEYLYQKLDEVAVQQESYNDEQAEKITMTTTTTTTTTESLISKYSSWGFENSESWDNQLVEVQRTQSGKFVHSDSKGKYVIIQEGSHHWQFCRSQQQFLTGAIYRTYIPKDVDAISYQVLDNDTISVVEPWDSYVLKITDRIVEDDILVFEVLNVNRNVYLIPYTWLDPIMPSEFYQKGETYGDTSYDYYKFYLK